MKYNEAIENMLAPYQAKSVLDYENAFKEIIQQITLLALWRTKFFEHALFYGGSALRILHGLDRFSEDLDFSLIKTNKKFSLEKYQKGILHELKSFGFEVEFYQKKKQIQTNIESAFLKANTLIHLLKINTNFKTHKNAVLQIKIEVDTNPPSGYVKKNITLFEPVNFSVETMDLPSLFSGKMHALLCRKRIKNVKGRDWYDLVWYVRKKIPLNKEYLKNKIEDSHPELIENAFFDEEILKKLFMEKVKETNFKKAKEDVAPFLKSKEQLSELDFWDEDYFIQTILPHLHFK